MTGAFGQKAELTNELVHTVIVVIISSSPHLSLKT